MSETPDPQGKKKKKKTSTKLPFENLDTEPPDLTQCKATPL